MATDSPQQHVTVTNEDGSIAFDGDWVDSDDDALLTAGIDVQACTVPEKATLARQQAFLAAYGLTGTVTAAKAAAGNLAYITVRRWREGDVFGFRDRFEEAQAAFADGLEALAFDRIRNPQGRLGSDILVITMLNAHLPAKYRQNVVVTGDDAKDVLKQLQARRTKRTTAEDVEPETKEPTAIEAMRERARGQ